MCRRLVGPYSIPCANLKMILIIEKGNAATNCGSYLRNHNNCFYECKYKKIYVLSIYYLGQTRTPNELVFNANSCASATLMPVARFKHRTSQRHLFTMLICRGINILTKRRPEEHNKMLSSWCPLKMIQSLLF